MVWADFPRVGSLSVNEGWNRGKEKEREQNEVKGGLHLTPPPNYWEKPLPSITHTHTHSYYVKAKLFRNGNSIPAFFVSPVLHEGMRKTVWDDYVSSKQVTTKWVNKPYGIHPDKIRDESKLHTFIQHPPHLPFLLFFISFDCQLKGRRWVMRFAIAKTLET